MLFDSHAHLDDEKYDKDREEIISSLQREDIVAVINAGASIESSKRGIELANKYSFIYASVGVHPHDVDDLKDSDIKDLKDMTSCKKVVAIGEIGLDYYYDNSDRENQQLWFDKQMQLACECDLPVIIHDRDAHADTLNVLKKYCDKIKGGVVHCFSGSWEMAQQILDMGFYIALGGIVTFKNAKRAVEVADRIPLNKLLIETDCPYLAPSPYRGKRNDPSLIKHTAARIAEIRNVDVDEISNTTAFNAAELFGIVL